MRQRWARTERSAQLSPTPDSSVLPESAAIPLSIDGVAAKISSAFSAFICAARFIVSTSTRPSAV